jgi:hypothetical protein
MGNLYEAARHKSATQHEMVQKEDNILDFICSRTSPCLEKNFRVHPEKLRLQSSKLGGEIVHGRIKKSHIVSKVDFIRYCV